MYRKYKHGIEYNGFIAQKIKFEFHFWIDHFFILFGRETLGLDIDLRYLLFQFVIKFYKTWQICSHFQFMIPHKLVNIDFTFIKTGIFFEFDFLFFTWLIEINDFRHEEYDEHTDIFEYQKKFDQLYPEKFYEGKNGYTDFYFKFYRKEECKRKKETYKNYLSTTLFRIYNDDYLNSPQSITLEFTLPFMTYISLGFIQPWNSGRDDHQGWKYIGFHIGMCNFPLSSFEIALSLFKYTLKIELGKNKTYVNGNSLNFENIKRFLKISKKRFIPFDQQSYLLEKYRDQDEIFDYLLNIANFNIMSLLLDENSKLQVKIKSGTEDNYWILYLWDGRPRNDDIIGTGYHKKSILLLLEQLKECYVTEELWNIINDRILDDLPKEVAQKFMDEYSPHNFPSVSSYRQKDFICATASKYSRKLRSLRDA